MARSLLTLAALAAPAAAQSAPPEGLECRVAVSPAVVTLGEPVTLTVTIANTSHVPLRVAPPEFDYQSVSLRLSWREPVAASAAGQPPRPPRRRETLLQRYRPTFRASRAADWRQLPAGESLTASWTLPMVHAGAVTLQALYHGFGFANRIGINQGPGFDIPLPIAVAPVVSEPVTVDVAPSPKGQLGAVIQTSMGDLEVELFPHLAPNHAINFLDLAGRKQYDDSLITRIKPGFVVQGGSPDGTGAGNPGYSIPAEFNRTRHVRGTLSMARGQDPYTAGCQFFLCLAANESTRALDADVEQGFPCTAFGRLIAGEDVLDKLAAVEVGPQQPGNPGSEKSKPTTEIVIKTITPFAR